jgi:putative peptidoglycan lipid II flippase
VQAPLGILAISVATVLFPGMSRQAAAGDQPALRESTGVGLRALLFLVTPVSAALVVFAAPVIRLLFERGEFGPQATATAAAALAAYAVGLVPMAGYYVVTRTFYALQNMRSPVAIGAVMVVVNAVLAYLLMSALAVAGIALATALVAYVNLALLVLLLRRALGPLGGRRIASAAARVAVATLVAMLAGWWTWGALPASASPGSQAASLGAALIVAGVVYLAACALLRVEELRLLRDVLQRRRLAS